MEKIKNMLIIILILLFLGGLGYFIFRPAKEIIKKVPVQVTVKVPEIHKVHDTVYVDSIIYKNRVVVKENEANKELLAKYIALKDSTDKLNMYINAITEREYKITYPDSTQDISVYSRVRGKLLEQQLEYTIHKQETTVDTTIEVPIEKQLELYGLIELGAPVFSTEQFNLSKFNLKATSILKNKNNDLFSFSIDVHRTIYLGYGKQF